MDIDKMVDRFLAWPLPMSVCSDLCVTKREMESSYPPKRVGTNLLTADEARQMLEHILAETPSDREATLEEFRRVLTNIANWRKLCVDYDNDMGNEPRTFCEDVELIEQTAQIVLKKAAPQVSASEEQVQLVSVDRSTEPAGAAPINAAEVYAMDCEGYGYDPTRISINTAPQGRVAGQTTGLPDEPGNPEPGDPAVAAPECVVVPLNIYEGALNYIRHVGANWTMRGEAHPQQWIVDGLLAAAPSVVPAPASAARQFIAGEISAGKLGELLGLERGEIHDFKNACKAFDDEAVPAQNAELLRDVGFIAARNIADGAESADAVDTTRIRAMARCLVALSAQVFSVSVGGSGGGPDGSANVPLTQEELKKAHLGAGAQVPAEKTP